MIVALTPRPRNRLLDLVDRLCPPWTEEEQEAFDALEQRMAYARLVFGFPPVTVTPAPTAKILTFLRRSE